jgi:hypothetical protein
MAAAHEHAQMQVRYMRSVDWEADMRSVDWEAGAVHEVGGLGGCLK